MLPLPVGPDDVAVILNVHPVLIVVVTLEDPDWKANTSPLNEFPANPCPAHVLTLHELGRVAVTFMVQEHATGEHPDFMTLGMFATQIELGGTGTVWPELFTVVAGQVTRFPPLGNDAVAVTPFGGLRMTVLTTEFPFGVRLLNVAVNAAGDVVTVDGAITRPKILAARQW